MSRFTVVATSGVLCATSLVTDASAQQDSNNRRGTYFESFEDPLGVELTIDGPGGLASQTCPRGASRSASDCFRGQRSPINTSNVCPFDEQFVPGKEILVHVDRDDWHVHTSLTPDLSNMGKALDGENSLHWGRHVIDWKGRPADSYCLSCLNTFISPDINLAGNKDSTLSFWHIAEFCDIDCFAYLPDTGDDFSIVEIRADLDPAPGVTAWGTWERLEPYFGVYDGMQDTLYTSPTFEPPDDINPDPAAADPNVTMCLPLFVFLSQGSARGTDAVNCTDGDRNGFPDCGHGPLEDDPSLRTPDSVSRGEIGVGVWVQSKFDLSRYRGRHIQYRFVATTLDDGFDQFISYVENVEGGPGALTSTHDIDDGWYIDAVTITNTVPNEGRGGRRPRR